MTDAQILRALGMAVHLIRNGSHELREHGPDDYARMIAADVGITPPAAALSRSVSPRTSPAPAPSPEQ